MDDYLAAPTPLAFWRKKRGLTQAGLAERAGITESELAEIESGKEEGRIGVLRALAETLGMTVDELVN
jgi:transcriptional regulator with XRE-family HTH domain